MSFSELSAALENFGKQKIPPYRVKQILSWIVRGAVSFDEMTNLPQSLRTELQEAFAIRGSRIAESLEDRDGTVKLQFALQDGAAVEAVLLASPRENQEADSAESSDRFTACLSTQVGCPISCVFCKTGSLGFLRNLDASEILEQFLCLSGLVRKKQEAERISHIVVMGMGEPLLNLSSLRKALEILCDKNGFGFSKRKITVSTSGIYRGILDMAENGPEAELALSLVTAREALRERLMPGTAGNSLSKLKEALKRYQKKQGRRITLEMVLLGGINTTDEDARLLAEFAGDLDAVINLIPWNPVAGLCFEGKSLREPARDEIENFRDMLEKSGLKVTRRYRRGRGVCGACGQLGGRRIFNRKVDDGE
jgi:23S rRNA (adenine2503-C2)-methyltransferase